MSEGESDGLGARFIISEGLLDMSVDKGEVGKRVVEEGMMAVAIFEKPLFRGANADLSFFLFANMERSDGRMWYDVLCELIFWPLVKWSDPLTPNPGRGG